MPIIDVEWLELWFLFLNERVDMDNVFMAGGVERHYLLLNFLSKDLTFLCRLCCLSLILCKETSPEMG